MVTDALGRDVTTPRPPKRVVSLVPSETETVAVLAGIERLAGRTDFCIEPAEVAEVPSVGGTKSIDVARVIALEPDLVLANQEENAKKPIEKLIEAGLTVHVSFPRTVTEGLAYLRSVAELLHVPPGAAPIRAADAAYDQAQARLPSMRRFRVFVPIWRDPWMTFDGRTFASDILDLCGYDNVFSDRPRRYPLAADVGDATPLSAEALGDRDTRYPRTTLAEVEARRPALVLLPDEPYAFGEEDRLALAERLRGAIVRLCDGKDLFWYGTRMAGALARLGSMVEHGGSPP